MHFDRPTEPRHLLFREALPADVRVATTDPRHAETSELLGRERAAVDGSVEKRQREFAAGRALARQLFFDLGVRAGFELLNRADRSPAWPPGVVGSITHCGTLAAVAVALVTDVAGIGIDVEPAEALSPGVDIAVMSPEERTRLRDGPPWMGHLVFSVKEAFYKAQYPITGTFLDFHDVEVAIYSDTAIARLLVEAPPYVAGSTFEVGWRVGEGLIATSCVLRPSGAPTAGRNDLAP